MSKDHKSWISDSLYEKVCDDISKWPDWKKRAYNEMFARSSHAKEVPVK